MRKEVIKQVKLVRIFFRSIRDALKSMSRNFSLSMASVICVSITLIIVSVASILAANVKSATNSVENEMNIIVYVKSTALESDIENIKSEIDALKEVRKYTFTSKEEMKQELSDYDQSFKKILDYLEENPLLDSFIVFVKDIKSLSETAKKIEKIPNIESVKYGEGLVEEIVSAFDIVEKVSIGFVVALSLVTIFLITNTIKLTIFSRKNEIEIMRLVGASNGTIKLPFIFEGLTLGLIGSIIPVCLTIYGYIILYNTMNGYMFTEALQFVSPYNFVFFLSFGLVIMGSIVGMFGSLFAVRKYLKI